MTRLNSKSPMHNGIFFDFCWGGVVLSYKKGRKKGLWWPVRSVSYETAGCQTVSIGVTQAKDEDADTLYNRVDKALYTAKAAGKNQVVRLD